MKGASIGAWVLALGLALVRMLVAQQAAPGAPAGSGVDAPAGPTFVPAEAVQRGCAILLEVQEGEGRREWPYEGVYRVGGTSIACLALIAAPGYADESGAARRAAVERGLAFVLESLDQPLMEPRREDDYDVRGWGFIYALQLCADLERRALVPEAQRKAVERAIPRLVKALEDTAIPKAGAWNYADQRAPAPFMTAPALEALFAAQAGGRKVSAKVVAQALASLERGRAASGSIAYSTPGEPRGKTPESDLGMMDLLPGSIGRMVASEAALTLGGLGDQERLAAAVEAFFAHWDQLEARRQKVGTHEQPYGVAPYYFMYAHDHAALAIELLDDVALRERQRARLDALLAQVAEAEGGWNDRVFPRSRSFGTAMGMLALLQRDAPAAARWESTPGKR